MTRELTDAQRLMVEDGLPPDLLLTAEERREGWKGMRLRHTKDFAVTKTAKAEEDPATKALRKELEAAEAKKKAERLARLKDLNPRAKPATKENDMSKKATAAAKKVAKAKKEHVGTKSGANSEARKPKAKAAQNARTPAAGCPDVVQQVADMMARPEGASMEEMVKATGIEAHPMRSKIKLVRDRLGYTTTPPSKENGKRYFAQPPKDKG